MSKTYSSLQKDITTPIKFHTSTLLRLLVGNLGIVTSFVLVIYAPDVVNLLLNFTAIEFVATLDASAFEIAAKGFLGAALQKKAQNIEDFRYDRQIRKRSTYARFFVYLLYFCAYTGAFLVIVVLQSNRHIGVHNEFYVQFDDTHVEELFGISGVYIGCPGFGTRKHGRKHTGTIGYVESSYHGNCVTPTKDEETNDMIFPANSFLFCWEDHSWVYIKKETPDPCDRSNHVVRSYMDDDAKASDAFDLLMHSSAHWLVEQHETDGDAELQNVFIENVKEFEIGYNCTSGIQGTINLRYVQ